MNVGHSCTLYFPLVKTCAHPPLPTQPKRIKAQATVSLLSLPQFVDCNKDRKLFKFKISVGFVSSKNGRATISSCRSRNDWLYHRLFGKHTHQVSRLTFCSNIGCGIWRIVDPFSRVLGISQRRRPRVVINSSRKPSAVSSPQSLDVFHHGLLIKIRK